MKITNRHNLPESYVRAAQDSADSHPPRKGKIRSVTQLISSPREFQLLLRYWDVLEEDVQDTLDSELGTAWHERQNRFKAPDELAEIHLEAEIGDWDIDGTADLYKPATKTLTDHKTTKTFKYILGKYDDYVAQLNVYRWLLEKNGHKVDTIKLSWLFKEWDFHRAQRDSDYPQTKALVSEEEIWSTEETEKFIEKRLGLHFAEEKTSDDTLPECLPSEMWAKEDTWAVKKAGRKSALRVLKSEGEAIAWKFDQSDQKGLSIEHRPGERTKCERFCVLAKNDKCNQWREYKNG